MTDQKIIDGLSELLNTVAGLQYETTLVFHHDEFKLRKELCSKYERLFLDATAIHLLHFEENYDTLIHDLKNLNEKIDFKEPWLADLLALERRSDHHLLTNQNHWIYPILKLVQKLIIKLDVSHKGKGKDEDIFLVAKEGLSAFNSLDENIKKDFSCLCILSIQAMAISASFEELKESKINHMMKVALEEIVEQPTMGIENLLFNFQVLISLGEEEEAMELLDALLEDGIRPFTPEVSYAETISALVEEWVLGKRDRTKKHFRKELPWFSSRSEEYWSGVQKILKEGDI